MSQASPNLAIVDWGIGGISILKLLKARLGRVPVCYFSDTGMTPYGKMLRTDLVARLNGLVQFLGSMGITHLVLGCNAASTVLPFLDPRALRIEGVIDSAVRVVIANRPSR